MRKWVQKLKLRLPALVMLLVTVLFWSYYDRYEPAGPVLLESPTTEASTSLHGHVSQTNGIICLEVLKDGKGARVDFDVPGFKGYNTLCIQARIRIKDVALGRNAWNCARVLLGQYDAAGKWIPGHHSVTAERGTQDWTGHQNVFDIHPNTARAVVVLQHIGLSGTAWFDDIFVQPIRLRDSFYPLILIFALCWVVLAGIYYKRCRLHQRSLRLWITLVAITILIGTLLPGKWINQGSMQMKSALRELQKFSANDAEILPAVRPSVNGSDPGWAQKQMDRFSKLELETHEAGHFVLFALLCFLVYLSAALERQHPAYFIKVGMDVLLFAMITESLQFLTLDRNAGLGDLRIDLYGMATALLLFLIIFPFLRFRRETPSLEI